MMRIFATGFGAILLSLASPASAGAGSPDEASPDRMAAARDIVAYVLPKGSYVRLMDQSMALAASQTRDAMLQLPVRELARIGLPEEDVAEIGDASLLEMMDVFDPQFSERYRITNTIMLDEMVAIIVSMEPAMRDGLAAAYASRFTLDELNELKAFFGTPVGGKYAASVMSIGMDPEVVKAMEPLAPALMRALPEIMAKARDASAHLPAPRKYEDLDEAEIERLEQMLGRDLRTSE